MFAATLDERDASRAASVIQKLATHECQIALTGGVAMEMLLRSNGRPSVRRPLNDLDFVVEDFATIPPLLVHTRQSPEGCQRKPDPAPLGR